MDELVLDDLTALIPPLLRVLEALGFIARHFDPEDFPSVLEATGTSDEALRAARDGLAEWPARLDVLRGQLERATDSALSGFAGLRAAAMQPDGVRAAFRALRFLPRAEEALYPLAPGLPAVSRYFLPPSHRADDALLRRLAAGAEETGIHHVDNAPGSRGGFSLYVPEIYSPERPPPLVMALHGGSGSGGSFLWTWLRDARARGALLVAPTATGPTWALNSPDADTSNLLRILDLVSARFPPDPARLLLTGMSDGGTFTYVSGLAATSPFTHLAPIAASFHPILAHLTDPARLRHLPIHITHGSFDWMFPVEQAHVARDTLAAAGAAVRFHEINDLSHSYPREINADILHWLGAGETPLVDG